MKMGATDTAWELLKVQRSHITHT